MAEASRRAAAPARKGGLPNAVFAVAAAEALPGTLDGVANRVTVNLPWGSLLRGALALDDRAAAGIASLVGPGGAVEMLLAPAPRDRLAEDLSVETRLDGSLAADWAALGLELCEARPATRPISPPLGPPGPAAWASPAIAPRTASRGASSFAVAGAPERPIGAVILGAMLGGNGPYGVAAPRILIVDDDPNLLVILAEQLRADGYEVQTARDGEEALRRLTHSWPDLLIIDMLMPRMDGLTLAREIKARADLPIIVLSAIDTADSKADLLDEVAEDYVTKPYHYPELRARVTRVLRRLGDRVPRQRLELGANLALELHRREAIVAGETVSLTPTESRLLYALAANLGQTVTTETLLVRGWADTEDADPSYVWVTMRRLRQKVEVDPNKPVHLLTVRGIGYRLVSASVPAES